MVFSRKIRARTAAAGVLPLLVFVFSSAPAAAQSFPGNTAVEQARLFQQRPAATSTSGGERLLPPLETITGDDAAADADIGEQWMLRPNLPVNPFTAYATFSLFGTSNVALSRTAERADAFAVADVGLGYSRALAPAWSLGLNLQQSFFRYDRYSAFDFESANVNATVSYQARQLGDTLFSLQYNLSRLTRGSLDDQIYLGNTLALTATKLVQLSTADAVDLNAAVAYTFADPSDLARVEVRFAVGYNLKITRHLTANAVARLEVYDYTDAPRQDLLQSIALGARWDLQEWAFLSASLSAVKNTSTARAFNYDTLNGGLSLTAHLRF